MGKKEEIELINQIKDYRQKFRDELKDKLLKEREERHNKGEVFLKGLWIPKNKVLKIQKMLKRNSAIIFLELHVLIFIVFLFNSLLWIIFQRSLLP
ncbi:hypothetical protein KY328_00270 [Candidatus Woesearchaeota archaeon]|nr:hypothetical protein [Candidatus Woesearchaeota archaeon]